MENSWCDGGRGQVLFVLDFTKMDNSSSSVIMILGNLGLWREEWYRLGCRLHLCVMRGSESGLFWIWSFQVEGRLGWFDIVIFDEVLFSFKITRAINNLWIFAEFWIMSWMKQYFDLLRMNETTSEVQILQLLPRQSITVTPNMESHQSKFYSSMESMRRIITPSMENIKVIESQRNIGDRGFDWVQFVRLGGISQIVFTSLPSHFYLNFQRG